MSDWNDECEDLFAAGRAIDVEPTPADRARIAKRVAAGVAAGTAVVSTSGALQAGTATKVAAAGLSKAAPLASLAKILIPLAVGVGAVTSAVVVVSRPSTTESASVSSAPAAPAVARAAPSVAAAPSSARVVEVEPPPQVVEPPPAVATHAPSSAPAPVAIATPVASASVSSAAPPQHDTPEEARVVRSIDDALRHGDFATALRRLDEHDATFGNGHFAEECAAARVLAVCGASASDRAKRSACAFFSEHPRSPMRTRIEAGCAVRCDGDR